MIAQLSARLDELEAGRARAVQIEAKERATQAAALQAAAQAASQMAAQSAAQAATQQMQTAAQDQTIHNRLLLVDSFPEELCPPEYSPGMMDGPIWGGDSVPMV